MIKQLKMLLFKKYYAKKYMIPRKVVTINFDDLDVEITICSN